MNRKLTSFAGGLAILIAAGPAVAGEQSTAPQVQALANRIRSTISALPADSVVAAYQAQITSTIESENATCEIVREALGQNYSAAPGEAQKALVRLRTTFAHCNFGTGAVGNGGGGYQQWGIGFSVGGGSSNYRP